MLELKGYITNLGKYNEGELIGEWVTFPIEEDELEEVFERIGISDEPNEDGMYYEEYFFTDWECEIDLGLGEYISIREVNELAEKIEGWDIETLEAASEYWSIEEVLENNEDDYILYSDVNNNYDLGYYWIEESGCYDLSNLGNLANYIDYEKFGRDIAIETNGGFTSKGFIEYVG